MALNGQYSEKDEDLAEISIVATTSTLSEPGQENILSGADKATAVALPSSFGTLQSRYPWTHLLCRHLRVASGLLALTIVLATIPASFGILYASNRQPIEAWRWQPAVYLAIFVAIADKAIQFAAFQGAIVAWWYHATQGTTYARLHQQWAMSIQFLPALTAGRRMNIAALACVAVALFGVNGPLLQRATSVDQLVLGTLETLAVNIAPQVPSNSTGTMPVQTSSFLDLERTGYAFPNTNPNFFPVVADQLAQIPISGGVSGCSGRCAASILAPALMVDKSNITYFPVNYTKPFSLHQINEDKRGDIIPDYLAVDIEMSIVTGTPETVVLKIGLPDHAAATTGVGNYVLTFYHLVPATAAYNVEIEDGTVKFPSIPIYPEIIARANNTDTSFDMAVLAQEGIFNVTTTLSGVAWGGFVRFYAYASVEPASNATGGTPALMDYGSPVMILQHQRNYAEFFNGSAAGPLMEDPTDSILGWLNQLMFRAGIWAAQTYSEIELQQLIDPGLKVRSNVTGTRIDAQSVYLTNYNYFAGVVMFEVMSAILVLVTFYGFWSLDRPVSMSPLEIAK